MLKGQVGALEVEWSAVKVTVQKGYQRMEKANERAERRLDDGAQEVPVAVPKEATGLHGFALKLAEMRK